MADDISVVISAQIAELQSGLSDATNALKQFTGNVENGLNQATNAGEKFGGKLETALNIGVFLELEEVATQALEAVQEAFEATIGKAEEFGLSNAKFAKIIGTSVEEATGLSEALKGVGSSTEQYEGLALRLGQRIGEQETKFKSLGIATRDSSGDLLGGKAAMDAVFAAMEKNPAQENSIAFAAFGRQAKSAFDIMRASGEDVSKLNDIMKEMGVQTGDTSKESAELEDTLNQLRVYWDSIWIAIGQRLLPILEDFAKWVTGPGSQTFGYFADLIKFVVVVVVLMVDGFINAGTIIGGVVDEMVEVLFGLGKAIYDGLTGNWGAIKGDVTSTWNDMKETFSKTMGSLRSEAEETKRVIAAVAGTAPVKPDTKGVYGSSDGQNPKVQGTAKPDDGKAAELARKIADEKLQAAEKEALEEVKIDEDKNSTLFAMGQITLDAFVEQQSTLENRKYQIQLEFLEKKAAADAKDKLAHQKDLDQIQELTGTHEEALLKIHDAALIKKQQDDRQDTQDYISDLKDRLTDGMTAIEEDYKLHKMSADEKAQAERNLTLTVEREVLARLDAEIAGLHPGTDAYKTALRQREAAVREFSNDVKKINTDLTNDERQKWNTLGSSIKSSFNGALNGLITGTESWQQALGQIIDGVANAFLNMGEEIVENWIAQQIEKEIFTKTTETTSALGQISAAAGVAGANAFAATAAIPVVGPELAPAAGAAAVAATLSFGSLAVAEKGMVLDRDRLVSAHEEEMILPSHLSRGIQDIIANGGTGGGDAHLHYSPTVNAPEQKGLKQMLIDESNTMLAWVNARMRDGSLKGRA